MLYLLHALNVPESHHLLLYTDDVMVETNERSLLNCDKFNFTDDTHFSSEL